MGPVLIHALHIFRVDTIFLLQAKIKTSDNGGRMEILIAYAISTNLLSIQALPSPLVLPIVEEACKGNEACIRS